MKSYLNILVFLFFSGLLSIFLLTLSYVLAIKNYTFEKVSAYECGFEPFNNSRGTFNIQFFIIGILFMIFDLEIAFLFPWSKNLHSLGMWGFWVGIFFLCVLTLGFIYEWHKGALVWSQIKFRKKHG